MSQQHHNQDPGHDPAYDRISDFLRHPLPEEKGPRVVELVRLFETIGASGQSSEPASAKSLRGSIDRAERLLKVINSPETIANLLATSLFYTGDKRQALRDITALVLKLGDISIGGKIAALSGEHAAAVGHTLGIESGDYRTTRHKRAAVPGWSIAHEVLIQLGQLLRERPDASDTFKLFLGVLNAGLACAKEEPHRQKLVRHAAMILEAATLPERKYFLDHGVLREGLRTEEDTVNLLHIEKLVHDLAVEGFRQGSDILSYLNLRNFGALAHRPNGAPPYRLLVSFKDAADSFSSKLLAGPIQFSMAVKALAAILEEPIDRERETARYEDTAKVNFRTAIVVSQAAIEMPLRERLDEMSTFDSATVSKCAAELLEKYFDEFTLSAQSNLTTLQREIAALLQTAHTQGREQHRLMHASRVIAPYRSLFSEPADFADAVRHLAFDRDISELALRSLPVLTRHFDDRYAKAQTGSGFFKLRSVAELQGMLDAAQKIVTLRPGQEVRTLRVASELLEVMFQTGRKSWVSDTVACLHHVHDYFTRFGVESLPFTFVSYLASKEGKAIEPILTGFLQRQLQDPEALSSSFHILRPYVASSPWAHAEEPELEKVLEQSKDPEDRFFLLASKLVSHLMTSKGAAGQPIPETVLSAAEAKALCDHLRSKTYRELYRLDDHETSPFNPVLLSPSAPTTDEFVAAYQAARERLAGSPASAIEAPVLGLDPLSAEVALHAQGVLHREYSAKERQSWPAVGLRPGSASVYQVSRTVAGIAIHTPRTFDFSLTHEGPVVRLPAQFDRVTQLPIHLGIAPDNSNHPTRIWDSVIGAIESLTLNARQLRDGAFLREWRRLRPAASASHPREAEVIGALKKAKNLSQWIDTAALAHSIQPLSPELFDWTSMALIANVDEIAMPEKSDVIGDRSLPLVDRARVLIELYGASVAPSKPGVPRFENNYQVVRLAHDVFRLSTLGHLVHSHDLRPDSREILRLGTLLTRGAAFTNLGAICETCATRLDDPASVRRNMLFMPYLLLNARMDEPLFAGGTGVISVYDSDGDPCLLLRGINPRASLLEIAPASEVYEHTADYLWELAQRMDYKRILAPDDYTIGRVLTNRPEILHHQQAAYAGAAYVTLLDPKEALFNGNEVKLPCREIRGSGTPKTGKAPRTADLH